MFKMEKSTWDLPEKKGKVNFLINIEYDDPKIGNGGYGFAVDSKQEALDFFYAEQKRLNLKNEQILWCGLEPQNQTEQLLLF